jgi:hypothetical protein
MTTEILVLINGTSTTTIHPFKQCVTDFHHHCHDYGGWYGCLGLDAGDFQVGVALAKAEMVDTGDHSQ